MSRNPALIRHVLAGIVVIPPIYLGENPIMLWITLTVLALLILLLVIYLAVQPSAVTVSRSVTMSAPAERIFGHVNNLRRHQAWSPWEKQDPNITMSYEGENEGPGAVCLWKGNMQVGEGRLTITESRPHDLIRMRLQMVKPFKCDNKVEFKFEPNGEGTQVTWSMTGRNHLMSRIISLFMNMDKCVGGEFEKGLNSMKEIAEEKG